MTVFPQCFRCKHLFGGAAYNCDAFPTGIPEAILTNDHDHRKPYDGDHGIRFEPKDGEPAEAEPETEGTDE